MTRRRARVGVAAAAIGVVVALGLSACGGDDDGAVGAEGGRDTAGTTRSAGDASAASYVGLTKRAAIAKADAAETVWRITREDDERFLATMDFVPDRLNFEIDDGTVTTVTLG